MKGGRLEAIVLGLSALVPACFAAAYVTNVADAAHDGGTARVLGFDPQLWRALDVVVGAVFAAIPIGTRAARAALGGAFVAGLAGALLFRLARQLLDACAEASALGLMVVAIVAVTPLVAAPWLTESAAVGGSAAGAVLILLPVALLAGALGPRARDDVPPAPTASRAAAAALVLAFGYEPLVGGCALAGCVALFRSSVAIRASSSTALRSNAPMLVASALAGGATFVVALFHAQSAGVGFSALATHTWNGEPGARGSTELRHFVSTELGMVLVLLALLGSGLAILVERARPLVLALLTTTIAGFACAALGAPLGPTRFGAPILAAFASACLLAGVAMQAAVRAIARARVPMASASAAMVVVLEAAMPVEMADTAAARSRARDANASSVYGDVAWASLPGRTLILVESSRVFSRTLAARAQGELRDDLTIVPTFLDGPPLWRVLAEDRALLPLSRDLELVGAPSESALSSLAAARPLAMAYEPRWAKAIGKHLVPATLFDRFEPEPRGASDRRRGLDTFARLRDRLAQATGSDAELTAAAVVLLGARAELATMVGEPDFVTRTEDDLVLVSRAGSVRE